MLEDSDAAWQFEGDQKTSRRLKQEIVIVIHSYMLFVRLNGSNMTGHTAGLSTTRI